MRFKTLHYYAGDPLEGFRTDTLGNIRDFSFMYYTFEEFFVRFYALSVRHRTANHLPIAIRSSLVVREINKIEPLQSGTPLCLSQIWSRTELDDTKSFCQVILTIAISEKNKVD